MAHLATELARNSVLEQQERSATYCPSRQSCRVVGVRAGIRCILLESYVATVSSQA